MKRLKPFLILLGKCILIYVGVLVLFFVTELDNSFRNGIVKVSNFLYSNISNTARIYSSPLNDPTTRENIQFELTNKKDIQKATIEARKAGSKKIKVESLRWTYNTTRRDLVPFLLILALVFSYPAKIRYQLTSLIICLLLHFIFIFTILGGNLLYRMHVDEVYFPNYQLPDWVAGIFYFFFAAALEPYIIAAILIWAVVMVRKEDLKKISTV